MLFNSFEFILLFLPISLSIFFFLGRQGHYRAAAAFLVVASLFFYGWWNPAYLGLIIGSVVFNYAVGQLLLKSSVSVFRKVAISLGITANLALLGYYKYANFFIANLEYITGTQFHFEQLILPLAISFFTFQQIAYLVDAYRGEVKHYSFLHYCLFVTFFPQLIAGPIVQHKEMLPQFMNKMIYRANSKHLAMGLSIFAIGLFKKVVIADAMAVHANPVFAAADGGTILHFLEAWGGALAYTLQLYFDFSGYADMAIGIARMFGVQLPINFNSPYKALNINDFWRRWHMTLGRFLRQYLYFPLGGNRKGFARTQTNIMLVMLLSGLWHGAGWNFVIWGGLHGAAMVVNDCWRRFRQHVLQQDLNRRSMMGSVTAALLTLLFVIYAWVFFRAETFHGAWTMTQSMLGLHGFVFAEKFGGIVSWLAATFSQVSLTGRDWMGVFGPSNGLVWIGLLFFVTWLWPNTQQLFSSGKSYTWKASIPWLIITLLLLNYSILVLLDTRVYEFLYFNF